MLTYWACEKCGETGSYAWADAPKTDAALPEAKHLADCGGRIVASSNPDVTKSVSAS